MNIIEKVQQDFDSMTTSERQVASYFFSHLNDFAFFTLDHIAKFDAEREAAGIKTDAVSPKLLPDYRRKL